MKLKRFIGTHVRGYMNFDISFNESLTFLIGINGTGKTTILKLLSGLLTPSYIELSQIDFSEIHLTCERLLNSQSNLIHIKCIKKENVIKLSYEEPSLSKLIEDEFIFSDVITAQRGTVRESIELEKLNRAIYDFEDLNVVREIRNLRTPLFLGLNRRVSDNIQIMPFEREAIYSRRRNLNIDLLFDSVDSALSEIEDMFHTHVRKNAQSQYSLSELFRKKVFSESFKVEEHFTIPNIEYQIELEKLDERREKLNDAIDKLEVKDLSKQFSEYFDSIKNTLMVLSTTSSLDSNQNTNPDYIKALLQWLVNCSQIEKIDNIIRYANEYSENIQRLKEPIFRFVESVNLFFKESGKEIEVDNKGEIKIKIKNSKKTNTVFELSSGEKQLIVMLAHIAFHKKSKNASIFIIDEPELSLHISWQEIFVDALLKASSDTQFILATHAPAIISHISRRENCIDLTMMN